MTYSIYLLIGVGLKSQIYVVMIMRVDYVGSYDPGPWNGICFHSRGLSRTSENRGEIMIITLVFMPRNITIASANLGSNVLLFIPALSALRL
jgi:hypothetical protein